MRAYIARLQQRTDNAATPTRPAVAEFTPLETQIQQLMASLPENQRNRDWTMQDLISRLTGKYRANPHAMQVAAALRRLAWYQPPRDYSRAGGGVRVWRCPD